MVAFHALNYTLLYAYGTMDALTMYQAIPDLIPVVILESATLKNCIDRNTTTADETDDGEGAWQTDVGCIKRKGFEEGIPIWKTFPFHFWAGPATPMGRNWTLSPENWEGWQPGNGNHYLGKLHLVLFPLTTRLFYRRPMYSGSNSDRKRASCIDSR